VLRFGTSGLRGLVSEMTDAACAAHVAAFLRHLSARDRFDAVLLGRDLRPSSPRIAAVCAAAIEAGGRLPVDCGVLPTPALALEAARRGVPAVMVSGSHVPFDRNGLKFYRAAGEIARADEAGILAALAVNAAPPPPARRMRASPGARVRYLARSVDFFGSGRLAGRRVGVWQHSAAGRDLVVEALAALGAEPVALGRSEDFVAIDTEAIAPDDADRIAAWVAHHRLDALVSTDGDGDRPLLAHERGAVLRGDALGVLTARALGADAVATPLNATTALERSGWFARIERTRIGSPHVIAGIERLTAAGAALPVGFEANGGFLLGGVAQGAGGRVLAPLPTRDAMIPLLALLAAAADAEVPLSALVEALPARATASDRLREIPPARSAAFLAGLAAVAHQRAELLSGIGADVAAVDTRDGVRMTLADGDVVHLRASGNAPELRVYTEAGTPGAAEALLAAVLARSAGRVAEP
jgi:phosphomannomutase